MSSDRIPKTQFVHIFNGEFQQLKSRLKEQIGQDGLCCFLYGLWTHTSNVVVHLVVSKDKEYKYARKHHLDCVGYVAKYYTQHVYDMVRTTNELSPTRQHVIVDVSETATSNSLSAYGTDHYALRASAEASSQGQPLQVNILPSESPFRIELNPGMRNMNGYNIESENNSESYSGVSSNATNPTSREENQVGNELTEMNGHQDQIDPNASEIKHFKHKLGKELGLGEHELQVEPLEKSSLSFHFVHSNKQWQIKLINSSSGKTSAEILFKELTGSSSEPQEARVEEFSAQNMLNKIQEKCQCEKCDIIRFTYKIKEELGVDSLIEEHFEVSSSSLHFVHSNKQWEIKLDSKSGKTSAVILFKELTDPSCEAQEAYVDEYHTENMLNKIKEICQCEKCSK